MSSHAPTASGSSEPHAAPHHKSPEKSERESAKAHDANSQQQDDLMSEKSLVQFMGLATAYLRAAESARPDRIINDPFAEKLAGDVAAQLMSVVSKWGPSNDDMMNMIAIRTRYLDEALANKSPKITQIVILASGMDSRAYRLDALKGCHVLEIDQSQDAFEQKKRTFEGMNAESKAERVDYIVADLTIDMWQTQLLANGFNPNEPTFWCLEGLLYYLDRSSIVKVIETMDALSAPGSQLWFDMCGKSTLESEHFGASCGLKYGENNPKDGILSILNWELDEVASLGEAGSHFGRDWEPLKLAEDSNDVLQWFVITGKKPSAHRRITEPLY